MLRTGFGIFSDILPGSVADLVGVNPPYVQTFQGGLLGTSRRHCAIRARSAEQRGRCNRRRKSEIQRRISQGQLSCASRWQIRDLSSAGRDDRGPRRQTPRALFHGVESGHRASIRNHCKRAGPIRRHPRREPALPDASERIPDGLSGLLCAIPLPASRRDPRFGAVTQFSTGANSHYNGLQLTADEAAQSRPARSDQLHLEPLHGHGFEWRISAIFRRRNSVAAARRTRARLRPLRLRHPPQPQRAVRLSIADESAEPHSGLCAERLAGLRHRVLAQRRSVFRAEHAIFGERKWNRARQRAAVRECGSGRAALSSTMPSPA